MSATVTCSKSTSSGTITPSIVEEVVVRANPPEPEHAAPHVDDAGLQGRARRHELVVGAAITRPHLIAEGFASALRRRIAAL